MGKKRRRQQEAGTPAEPVRRARTYPFLIVLAVLTLAVYWQAASFKLTNYDDSGYISRNPAVASGLNAASFKWAFTEFYQFNWHPLTWLSLMADMQLTRDGRLPSAPDGQPSGRYFHITNIALHLANVLLLFVLANTLLRTASSAGLRMQSAWIAAFVAALFAVHPLHVESVAWVTERKDVLSTLFGLVTMLCYVVYVRAGEGLGPGQRATAGRQASKSFAHTALYLLAVLAFALGLLAKPMLVTLPVVLLLLDYWPLRREQKGPAWLLVEKAPLFALAAGSCAITVKAQSAGGAVTGLGLLPIGVRLANAAVSSVAYIGKMLWPANLAAFYPHPNRSLPEWQTAAAVVVLLAISAAVVALRKRAPYLLVGWLWYVITLIPVSGILQVGEIGMADRYTYVPLIGLSVMLVCGAADLVGSSAAAAKMMAGVGAAAVVVLAVLAYHQAGYWRDSIKLWNHTIEITHRNAVAESNLADAYVKLNDHDSALPHLRRAIAIRPKYPNARFGLGFILSQRGQWAEAAEHFKVAVQTCPNNPQYHHAYGVALANSGHPKEAIEELLNALGPDPDNPLYRQTLEEVQGAASPK
jgi:tetratricopeptide (TPR) repeat protein